MEDFKNRTRWWDVGQKWVRTTLNIEIIRSEKKKFINLHRSKIDTDSQRIKMAETPEKQTKPRRSKQEVAPIWGATTKKLTPRNAPSAGAPAFAMNTTIGQHILQNPQIAQSIVDKSNIMETDTVLEIGPGTGNLTMRILAQAQKVIAIEMDPRMARELAKRGAAEHANKKLDIILGDCLKLNLPYHDLCISNMPYQISSPIIYKLLGQNRPPRESVLMFQHEFNLRLLARPGESAYGRISATVQRFANVSLLMKVGRNNFRPPPAVESSVIKIEMKQPVSFEEAQGESQHARDFKEWDGLLRICFVRKNKTISACFKSTPVMKGLTDIYKSSFAKKNETFDDEEIGKIVKDKISNVLEQSGYSSKRSNKCNEADFEKLLEAFNAAGVSFAALGEVDDQE